MKPKVLIIVALVVVVNGQYFDEEYTPLTTREDPLRRTLGLLGRVLNRMAQKNPPTDDQLRFHVDNPSSPTALPKSNRSKPDKFGEGIINEEFLQRILPRVKGETTTTTTTTTTPAPTTKTTTTTTTEKTTPTTTTTTTTTPATTTTSTMIPEAETAEDEDEEEFTVEDAKNAQIIAEALKLLFEQESNNTDIKEKFFNITKETLISGKKMNKNKADSSTTKRPTKSTKVPPTSTTPKSTTTKTEPTTTTTTATTTTTSATTTTTTQKTTKKPKTTTIIPENEEEDKTKPKLPHYTNPGLTPRPLTSEDIESSYLGLGGMTPQDMSSVLRPVNSIVDGIGPLILPLFGYGQKMLQGTQNNQIRAQGVANYQPEQSSGLFQGFNAAQSRQPIVAQNGVRQISAPSNLKTASTYELLQALQQASPNGGAQSVRGQQQPFQRYIPDRANSQIYSQQLASQNQNVLDYQNLVKAYMARQQQQQQPQQQQQQPQQIMNQRQQLTQYTQTSQQNAWPVRQPAQTRHRELQPAQALPSELHSEASPEQGLHKVAAFRGDSGVFTAETPKTRQPVNPAPAPAPAQPWKPPTSGGGNMGFGGGRRPQSFDEVEKNTEEAGYGFFG